jgi:hypothetical protein
MSLLREIQEAAVDASTPLPVVLRKCMVLAARLGHEPFKKWVDDELNGYPPDTDLPAYRRIGGLTSIGTFFGPMGTALRNMPLPLAPVPADLRDKHSTAELREAVARLEDLAYAHKEGDELISRWSSDLIAQVAYKCYEGYTLVQAHIEFPRSAFVATLDSVRNKVLKFALEIEQQNPEAGDVPPGTKPVVPAERVAQIFNTYIMGGAQNVAVASPSTIQHAQQLQAGDIASLRSFLVDQGLQESDVAELKTAIAEDPKPAIGQPFGKRVAAWMGTMVSKAASGVWKVGTSAATDVLTAAPKAYYGLA